MSILSLVKAFTACIIFLSFPAYQVTASTKEDIEKNIWKKDWQAVDAILGSPELASGLNNASLKEEATYLVTFLRGYDACEETASKTSAAIKKVECLRDLLHHRDDHRPKNALVYFSHELVDNFNQKSSAAADEVREWERQQRVIESQQRDVERQRVEQQRELARNEAIAESIYQTAKQKAEATDEYKSTEAACSICFCLEKNVLLEQVITEEKKYSKKYGVVNLTRIDNAKHSIMVCDRTIREQKAEYSKIIGKKFDKAQCHAFHDQVDENDAIDCDNSFIRTGKKIIQSFIATQPETIQSIILEKHLKPGYYY